MLSPFTFFFSPCCPFHLTFITFPPFSMRIWLIIFYILCYQLSLQKQALDKELGTLKEKLKWTEGQLQESQKKESQTQAKLTVLPLPSHPHTLNILYWCWLWWVRVCLCYLFMSCAASSQSTLLIFKHLDHPPYVTSGLWYKCTVKVTTHSLRITLARKEY